MILLRKRAFTLIEICLCIAIIGMLASFATTLSYSAIDEYKKRSARAAFRNDLTELYHKNALVENNLMLLISQKGQNIETLISGNTKGLSIKKLKNTYYVGKLFEEGRFLSIEITPRSLPSDKELSSWIEKNDCIYKFYED
jgi:prepilin-type N-terminal cleavage/methylation domain-containing protein